MVFDILSVIFGILLTVRKLDVSRRQASEFPNVDPAAFERWRAYAASVYSLASWACFVRVIASVVFTLFVAKHLPWNAVRVVGAVLDLGWAFIMILTVVRSGRARKQRDALGIVLR
jgi:hypothetical protein